MQRFQLTFRSPMGLSMVSGVTRFWSERGQYHFSFGWGPDSIVHAVPHGVAVTIETYDMCPQGADR